MFSLFKAMGIEEGVSSTPQTKKLHWARSNDLGRRVSSRPDLGTDSRLGGQGTAASKGPGRGQGRASTSEQKEGRMKTLHAS